MTHNPGRPAPEAAAPAQQYKVVCWRYMTPALSRLDALRSTAWQTVHICLKYAVMKRYKEDASMHWPVLDRCWAVHLVQQEAAQKLVGASDADRTTAPHTLRSMHVQVHLCQDHLDANGGTACCPRGADHSGGMAAILIQSTSTRLVCRMVAYLEL